MRAQLNSLDLSENFLPITQDIPHLSKKKSLENKENQIEWNIRGRKRKAKAPNSEIYFYPGTKSNKINKSQRQPLEPIDNSKLLAKKQTFSNLNLDELLLQSEEIKPVKKREVKAQEKFPEPICYQIEDQGIDFDRFSQKEDQSSSIQFNGRWSQREHKLFLEGLKSFGKDWKKIEAHIGTRTCAQIRSHAQKFYQRLDKAGMLIEMPNPFYRSNSSTSLQIATNRESLSIATEDLHREASTDFTTSQLMKILEVVGSSSQSLIKTRLSLLLSNRETILNKDNELSRDNAAAQLVLIANQMHGLMQQSNKEGYQQLTREITVQGYLTQSLASDLAEQVTYVPVKPQLRIPVAFQMRHENQQRTESLSFEKRQNSFSVIDEKAVQVLEAKTQNFYKSQNNSF